MPTTLTGFASLPGSIVGSSFFGPTPSSGNNIKLTATGAPQPTNLPGFPNVQSLVDGGIITLPFGDQPFGGLSSLQAGQNGTWWVQPDNGYGRKDNSGDFLLGLYQIAPTLNTTSITPSPTTSDIVGTIAPVKYIQYRDPDNKINIPNLTLVNGNTPERNLTGADFDIESFVFAQDGTIWVGDEFGPYLLHFDATGKLLEAPIAIPDVRAPQNPAVSPQNPTATLTANLSTRGLESLAINPSRTSMYTALEGVVTGDPTDTLRIYKFDLANNKLVTEFNPFTGLQVPVIVKYKLDGTANSQSINDMTAINETEYLVIEKDRTAGNNALVKKIYKIDFSQIDGDGYVQKELIVDLLDIQDPLDLNGDGLQSYKASFQNVEAFAILDSNTLILANDNDYPFIGATRTSGPNAGKLDGTEFIKLTLSTPLNFVAPVPLIPPSVLTVGNATVVEGQVTTVTTVSINVNLDTAPAVGKTVTVQYTIAGVTATAGSDFTAATGTLSFAAGVKTATITVPITDDFIVEGDETFTVKLSNATGNAIISPLQGTGVVTITDGISASVTTVLAAKLETLTLTGTGSINGTGNTNNNLITGNTGNNTLSGLAGNDTLIGGAGNDTYLFAITTANLGSDTITDGSGVDTVSFAGSTASIVFDLGLTTIQTVGAGTQITLTAADAIENAIGGNGNDIITGNTGNNTLTGGAGNDSLDGGVGNDTLSGLAGNDTLIGGAGNDTYLFAITTANLGSDTITDGSGVDTVSFAGSTASIVFDLGLTTIQTVGAGTQITLTAADAIENAIGGNGADSLFGNDLNNRLDGGAGNDTLAGGLGNDTLIGGTNDDTYLFAITTNLGSDTITEASGVDTVSFAGTTSGITFNLGLSTIQTVDAVTGTQITLTATTAIDNAIGGNGADRLSGNTLSNRLDGGAGNDTLTGVAGNDTLIGGAGNDTYLFAITTANLGSDTITDVSGVDTVSFAGSTASIVFDLGLTTIQTVGAGTQITLTAADAIENAIGGNGADSLFGNDLNNRLDGGAGNDTLAGGLGNDTLVSGTGNDQFVFNGISAFGAVANGVDTITDFATTDKLVLSKTVFTALTSVVGAGFSVASNFAAVAVANNDLAGSNNALIVYNKTTGSLLYNQNGSAAGFGTGGEVANIFSSGTTTPVLAASNFIVIV